MIDGFYYHEKAVLYFFYLTVNFYLSVKHFQLLFEQSDGSQRICFEANEWLRLL